MSNRAKVRLMPLMSVNELAEGAVNRKTVTPDKLKLLSVDELSERTGIPKWSMYEMVKRGELPHLKLGKRVFFSEPVIESWIATLHERSITNRQI